MLIRTEPTEILKWVIMFSVQWTWYGPEDVTWEHEDAMRAEYPHLFEDFGNLVDVV
jgi:hypothetical protein